MPACLSARRSFYRTYDPSPIPDPIPPPAPRAPPSVLSSLLRLLLSLKKIDRRPVQRQDFDRLDSAVSLLAADPVLYLPYWRTPPHEPQTDHTHTHTHQLPTYVRHLDHSPPRREARATTYVTSTQTKQHRRLAAKPNPPDIYPSSELALFRTRPRPSRRPRRPATHREQPWTPQCYARRSAAHGGDNISPGIASQAADEHRKRRGRIPQGTTRYSRETTPPPSGEYLKIGATFRCDLGTACQSRLAGASLSECRQTME